MALNKNLNEVLVRLKISDKRVLAYYQGKINWVVCNSIDGRIVKFPARVLQLVVDRGGVSGLFRLRFKGDGSFYDITKIKD